MRQISEILLNWFCFLGWLTVPVTCFSMSSFFPFLGLLVGFVVESSDSISLNYKYGIRPPCLVCWRGCSVVLVVNLVSLLSGWVALCCLCFCSIFGLVWIDNVRAMRRRSSSVDTMSFDVECCCVVRSSLVTLAWNNLVLFRVYEAFRIARTNSRHLTFLESLIFLLL